METVFSGDFAERFLFSIVQERLAYVRQSKGAPRQTFRSGHSEVGVFHVKGGGSESLIIFLDEGQITHLICARLKYDLYDFFRGCFGPASCSFL